PSWRHANTLQRMDALAPIDPAPAALPPMDTAGRIDRLRELFDGAGIDALVVTNLRNVRYLTGFTGSAGHLVVTGADAVLVTDERYSTQADEQLRAAEAPASAEITTTGQKDATVAAITGCARIGL